VSCNLYFLTMVVSMSDTITLTRAKRMELERRAASRTGRAEDARRARAILLLADGHTWDETCDRVPCSRGFLASWSRRFAEQRIAGLYSRQLGQGATVLTPQLEAQILDVTRRPPPHGGDALEHAPAR
jgi:Homeodomain-like domain